MSLAEYRKAVQDIESRGVMPDSAPSLEPMKKGLTLLFGSVPLNPSRTLVVAGTNGKGSVCASLEALLLSAGQTVGLYTSPHLEETTERIRINGQDVSIEVFCDAYQEVIRKTGDQVYLSHFEILTLMAAWIFYSEKIFPKLDWVILEVGLGGTWDATNAIPHDFSIITSLGFDHQNLLGNTLPEIARNKFGIVSPGNQVIHSPLPPEVETLAKETQQRTLSHWFSQKPFRLNTQNSAEGPQFILDTEWGNTTLRLPGRRAAENSMTALTAFEKLGFQPGEHLHALSRVRWPGRMERLSLAQFLCPVYLSGDHNPQGAASLVEVLQHFSWNRLFLLVGIGKDKDADGILSPLVALPKSSLFLTETPFRGRSLDSYGRWKSLAQGFDPDPMQALETIRKEAGPQDLIVVTGSLYLIGLVRKNLQNSGK